MSKVPLKSKVSHSHSQEANILDQYFPSDNLLSSISIHTQYSEPYSPETITISKNTYLTMVAEIKSLRKALKSQKKMFDEELNSLRFGLRQKNYEAVLIKRQEEYLKDMEKDRRARSQGKIKMWKSHQAFYQHKKM